VYFLFNDDHSQKKVLWQYYVRMMGLDAIAIKLKWITHSIMHIIFLQYNKEHNGISIVQKIPM